MLEIEKMEVETQTLDLDLFLQIHQQKDGKGMIVDEGPAMLWLTKSKNEFQLLCLAVAAPKA